MNIAIIGAGAIGSVVAAYLTKAGIDSSIVGKEEQVKAISKNGLKISGIRGQEIVNVKVLTKLDKPYDLVIFTVKTQDLEEAYQHNVQFLDDCFVLTSQNGVQADNILGVHFEKERMLSSIVMFGATYINPGEIVFNFEGDWILGRPFSPVDAKIQEIAEILRNCFNVVVSHNIMGMKYLKLFVNLNNCIPALLGKSMQEVFMDMDFCKLSVNLLKEAVDIIKKAKIELVSLPQFPVERIYGLSVMPLEQAAEAIHQSLTSLSREPLYGSILQSILRWKESEIDFINGEIVCLAKQMRQSAPLNERVVDKVHQVQQNKKFFTPEEIKKEFHLN